VANEYVLRAEIALVLTCASKCLTSGTTSAREDVYEVSSPDGPPAYYGADGLLLNQSQVQALHASANELPHSSAHELPKVTQNVILTNATCTHKSRDAS